MNSLFSINSPLWRFMDKALRLVWLNLLWLLCCLPIVTIGSATAALYSVTLKYVRDEESYLTRSFFKALKENFLPATLIWIIMTVCGIILGVDLVLYLRMPSPGPKELLFMLVFFYCDAVVPVHKPLYLCHNRLFQKYCWPIPKKCSGFIHLSLAGQHPDDLRRHCLLFGRNACLSTSAVRRYGGILLSVF